MRMKVQETVHWGADWGADAEVGGRIESRVVVAESGVRGKH